MNFFNFEALGRDDQSKAAFIQKYKEFHEKWNAETEQLVLQKNHNEALTLELFQLQDLVFKQKSQTKREVILSQNTSFDFMNIDKITNPEKVKMECFQKLIKLTSETRDRITKDYKLNAENRLDMLVSEVDTLEKTLAELNSLKEANKKIHEDMQIEQINICNQIDKEVVDYNCVVDEINHILGGHQKHIKHLRAELKSKENELAVMKNHIYELNIEEKSMEQQCELLKESSPNI